MKLHQPGSHLAALTRLVIGIFVALGFSSLTVKSVERQVFRDQVPVALRGLKPIDRLAPGMNLNLAIALPLRNRGALTNFLQQIYDPASANFRHYLTPAQFTERFGPTREDYQAVMEFAKSQGLTVMNTYSNRALLDVSGPVASIEKVFHVHLHEYQHPFESRTFYAPDADPSVDATVPILEVTGLNNYVLPRPTFHHPAKAAIGKPNMGSGPGGTFMGNDFRKAYVPGVTLTGAGQKVGLFELDGYYTNDPVQYASMAGLTNVFAITNVLVDGFNGTPGEYNGEVALDIEMVMAMAPGAEILVYEGSTTTPTIIIDLLTRMATDNLAQQLSSSWQYGTGPSMVQVYQEMAAQGQSYFNSSGDLGAYSGQVTSPSDDPYITVVGGTTLTTTTNGSWASETVWNWTDTGNGPYASGGGISTTWGIPSWQQGINMTTNGGSTTMRNLPDVAMVADNVEIVADNGQPQATGGTSIATPLWAAFTALVNQRAVSQGQQTVGFINPVIYALGQSTNYGTSFHDIITGNNVTGGNPTNFSAVPGYDLCTGWGSPTTNLIEAMLSYQFVSPEGWALTSLPSLEWSGVASSTDGTILAAASLSSSQIYISSSSGVTWRGYGPVTSWRGIACSADGSRMAAASWEGPIYISTNTGVTWTATTSPSYSWRSMASSADGTKLASGAFFEDAIGISTNSGASWTTTGLPGQTSLLPVAWSADGSLLVAGHGRNTVFVSTNNGVTWITNTLSLLDLASVAASSNGAVLYAAGGSAIYISTNFGTTWTTSGAPSQTWSSVACSADGHRIVAVSEDSDGYDGMVGTSSDQGVTWSNVSPTSASWSEIACSADGSRWIAAYETSTEQVYTGFFPIAPTILSQPTDQTVQYGLNTSFAVSASGTLPISYQWYFGSNPLSDGAGVTGSATPSLALTAVSLSQSGVYTLNVANPYGSTNSIGATLSVQLTNLPVLNSLSVQPNGSVTGSVSGFSGSISIESSTNLVNWTVVTNIVLTDSAVQFIDSAASNYPQRFYRARVE